MLARPRISCLLSVAAAAAVAVCGPILADEPVATAKSKAQRPPINLYDAHRASPPLLTPRWVGEPGVEAVVVLAIDDMRDPAKYETFLRPILNRLKAIDGRAPVSIMTNQVNPADPRLQAWLKEGLSIECHTLTHPCPLLQKSDLAEAARTYHGCVQPIEPNPRQ